MVFSPVSGKQSRIPVLLLIGEGQMHLDLFNTVVKNKGAQTSQKVGPEGSILFKLWNWHSLETNTLGAKPLYGKGMMLNLQSVKVYSC